MAGADRKSHRSPRQRARGMQGSRYSFSGDYYKHDLLTVVNDNHGTGIMMLAGAEIIKLKGMLGGK